MSDSKKPSRKKARPQPGKVGRPSKRTPEIEHRIIEQLSKGKILISICEPDDMPDRVNVYRWMENDTDFATRVREARERGFDAIAEECLKIADYSALDTLINEKTGNPHADQEWIARSRLRVETRLRLLAKWSPKKYGDKIETQHSGEVAMVVRPTIGGKQVP
jgi:hypothetical protein